MSEEVTKELLEKYYIKHGMSLANMSRCLNTTVKDVRLMMENHNITIKTPTRVFLSKEYLEKEYIEKKRSTKDISKDNNCSQAKVVGDLKKRGIKLRDQSHLFKDRLKPTKEQLQKLYTEEKVSVKEIAKMFKFNKKMIIHLLKEYKLHDRYVLDNDLNLKGAVMGKLTILSRHGDSAWLCLCKCGAEKIVSAQALLRTGKPTRACGCGNREGLISAYSWNKIKVAAKARGIFFNITREYIENIFEKQNGLCAMTGIPLVFAENRDLTQQSASLDRIDSNIGYEPGNLQWVHKDINMMKRHRSDEYFINLCRQVVDYADKESNG